MNQSNFVLIPKYVLYAVDISNGAKILYTFLLSFRNRETGLCCPSVDTLTREMRTTKKTTEKYLRELRAAGYISVRKKTKYNEANCYEFYTNGELFIVPVQ